MFRFTVSCFINGSFVWNGSELDFGENEYVAKRHAIRRGIEISLPSREPGSSLFPEISIEIRKRRFWDGETFCAPFGAGFRDPRPNVVRTKQTRFRSDNAAGSLHFFTLTSEANSI